MSPLCAAKINIPALAGFAQVALIGPHAAHAKPNNRGLAQHLGREIKKFCFVSEPDFEGVILERAERMLTLNTDNNATLQYRQTCYNGLLEWLFMEVSAANHDHSPDSFNLIHTYPTLHVWNLYTGSNFKMLPIALAMIANDLVHFAELGAPLKAPAHNLSLLEEQELFVFVMERLISRLGFNDRMRNKLGDSIISGDPHGFWSPLYPWLLGNEDPLTMVVSNPRALQLSVADARWQIDHCGAINTGDLFKPEKLVLQEEAAWMAYDFKAQGISRQEIEKIFNSVQWMPYESDLKLAHMLFRILANNSGLIEDIDREIDSSQHHASTLLDHKVAVAVAKVIANEGQLLPLAPYVYHKESSSSEVAAVVGEYIKTFNALVTHLILDHEAQYLKQTRQSRLVFLSTAMQACRHAHLHFAADRLSKAALPEALALFKSQARLTEEPENPDQIGNREHAWRVLAYRQHYERRLASETKEIETKLAEKYQREV